MSDRYMIKAVVVLLLAVTASIFIYAPVGYLIKRGDFISIAFAIIYYIIGTLLLIVVASSLAKLLWDDDARLR